MGVWFGFLLAGSGCLFTWIFYVEVGFGPIFLFQVFPQRHPSPVCFPHIFLSLCFIAEKVLEALKAMLENAFSKTSFFLTKFFGFGGLGVLGFESLGGKQDRGAPNSGRPLLWMKFQVCL